jgi:hydroxyacylglutathione hydrolase
MILKRFYEDRLAQASYLAGCSTTGEAIVIDANRDIDQYIRAAEAEGLRIVAVTETHIHADYVSGSRALAQAVGARLYVSGEGGPDWQYAFAGEPNVQLLHHGDHIQIGNVQLRVRHTPGHTPEHLTFVIVDEPATSRPLGAFTGDFIFVGDVGRPDLLERAAGQSGTMQAAARTLHASLRRAAELPDYLLIWPAHGAGSACGKSLGGVPVSSLGYEKLANWAFGISGEEEFVRKVLEDQPEPPRYFAEMKRVNKIGLPAWTQPELKEMPEAEFAKLLKERAVAVDIRETDAFAGGYAQGSIGIPFVRNFLTWAGSLLAYGEPVYLIACNAQQAAEAARALSLIGLDDVAGWFPADKLGRIVPLSMIEQLAPEQVAAYIANGATVVDVRGAAEYRSGHIEGSLNIPLPNLQENLSTLPVDKGLLVHCQGGTRSAIAASVLRRAGFQNIKNLTGGFAAYAAQGGPVEIEAS